MFSIEPAKKTNVPSGLYWPSQSYYHSCLWEILCIYAAQCIYVYLLSLMFMRDFSSSDIMQIITQQIPLHVKFWYKYSFSVFLKNALELSYSVYVIIYHGFEFVQI